jgi:leucyl-tRNA synthetase
MRKYIPQEFEKNWAAVWDKEKVYAAGTPSQEKPKKYILDMFPYPSGAGLHVGHPRGYVGSDILARYYRMKGFSVLHPMGWDAFGLPAENAAIKAKRNPAEITKENIANFKRQLKMLGFSYDWDREFATTDPTYFKWTQWLFIEFYKMGLLYKKLTPVYYCPFCKTGLAQEEVLPNNTHERCQKPIEMRDLPQWIFKITSYGDRLVDELKGLDWPPGILEMQKNWIGRKKGINITYTIKGISETITCFTTRPDTNFGATFVVLAPDHEFVKKIQKGEVKVDKKIVDSIVDYVSAALAKTEQERIAEGRIKTGVFTGFYAINHLTGKEMPIWVSDFVLSGFGTGAVVGVPGHDLRDFEFAQAMGIEVVRVVAGKDGDASPITKPEQVQEEAGVMMNSGFLDGLEIHEATEKIMDYMEEKGWGKRLTTFHLRDWIFSRQRYWGEPIPMVYCSTCADKEISFWETKDGKAFLEDHQNVSKVDKELQKKMVGWFPIDQKSLPLELPFVESYEPNESGQSPLAKIDEWINTKCPNCGGPAERESDTMPNWAGSCWYFLRFADPHNTKEPWSKKALEWLPVDFYVGGAEHAVLHLLYSRFWVKALQDLGLVNFKEPFLGLRNQGMILAEDHRKMSKSWGNVINPDDVVNEYGADALRVYEMFMAPFNQEIAWSTRSLQGTYRFVKRVWDIFQFEKYFAQTEAEEDQKLLAKLHKTIDKVTRDIADVKFNTAIAAMMEFLNEWEKNDKVTFRKLTKDNAKKFLQILAPFASFTTEEIWRNVLGEKGSIHTSEWPLVDKKLLIEDEVTIPVQVNGKMRGVITLSVDIASEEEVIAASKKDEKIAKHLQGNIQKVIFVPGKILNFIVG